MIMAVKASNTITLASIRDVSAVTRYYILKSAADQAPSKPSANPPGGSWVTTEPSYTNGSTDKLYFTDLTTFSDGSYSYSDVCLSSAYEAAKTAYNKAVQAEQAATQAARTATNYLYMSDQKGLVVSQVSVETDSETERLTTPNSRIVADGFDVYRDGTTRVAHFGATTAIGESGNPQQIIDGRSMKFTAGNSNPVFTVENNVAGNGYFTEARIWLSQEDYLNVDGTINRSGLAGLIDAQASGKEMASPAFDYVSSAAGASLSMELAGAGEVPNVGYTDYMSAAADISFSSTVVNGVLSIRTTSESEPSDWYELIDDFLALFPQGTINHQLYLQFTLSYSITDAQMTLGARKTGSTVGARSVSFGSDNVASGTGSVAIGKDLTVTDDYSVVIGENNIIMEDSGGRHMPTAFAIGTNAQTPFAVLKNGIITMSSVNTGKAPQQTYQGNSRTDVRIDFEHEYPGTPFIFLTLNEDNIPAGAVSDYGRVQIYLKSADTTGFTATVVNGGSANHTFGFSWFAISVL